MHHRFYPNCYHAWLVPRGSDTEEYYEPCFKNRYQAFKWVLKYEAWGYGEGKVRRARQVHEA